MINKDETEENKLKIRRFYYELLNQGDSSLINEFFAPRAVIKINGMQWRDISCLSTLMQGFYNLVEHPHFEVMTILAEGDMVCTSWKMIAKTDNASRMDTYSGICIARLEAQKIVQLNHRSDLHRLFNSRRIGRRKALPIFQNIISDQAG